MEVNSHIQVNRALLRNFSQRNSESGLEEVYYLEISSQTIKRDNISDVGTKYGYYDSIVEDKLSQIESKFGNVATAIKQFGKSSRKTLKLSSQISDVIKLYMTNLLVRSEQFRESTNRASVYGQFIGGFSSNIIIGRINIEKFKWFFDKYQVCLIDNVSDIQFVLPRNGIYAVTCEGKKAKIILPVTPSKAIVLVEPDEMERELADSKATYYQISDNNIVHQFNVQAYLTEKSTNNHFVVAKRQNELQMIINSQKDR